MTWNLSRRNLLMGLPAMALVPAPTFAAAAAPIVVHRDPGCGCCEQWAAQVKRAFGRPLRVIDDSRRAALQRQFGLPVNLSSCHTAIIDGLAFEGHVPVADMKRLLATRPRGIRGLAVAGMPLGSLGMEVPGARSQPYNVMAFGTGALAVFARH